MTLEAQILALQTETQSSNVVLAVNATLTLSFQVTIFLPLSNGSQIFNQATYQSDQLTSPNTSNLTINPVASAPILNYR